MGEDGGTVTFEMLVVLDTGRRFGGARLRGVTASCAISRKLRGLALTQGVRSIVVPLPSARAAFGSRCERLAVSISRPLLP